MNREMIQGGDPEGVRENKQATEEEEEEGEEEVGGGMFIQKIADITGNADRTKEGKEQRVENGQGRKSGEW